VNSHLEVDSWRSTALARVGSPALLMKNELDMTVPRHQLYMTRKFRQAVFTPTQSFQSYEVSVRHGKTVGLTKAGIAWAMLLWPERDFLITSASQDLVDDASEWIQAVVRKVGREFGIGISTSQYGLSRWKTNRGGGLLAISMNTAFQGFGFFVIGIDDYYASRAESMSEKVRNNRLAWYDGSLRDRLDPDGTIYVACARWHEADLQGVVTSRKPSSGPHDEWEVISMPAIATPPPGVEAGPEWRDEIGRAEGEPLWPEVRSLEELLRARANNPVDFMAKYQQQPYSAEGKDFSSSAWRFVDTAPPRSEFRRLVRAWDFAATRGAGDWTVGWLMGLHQDGSIFVLHEVRQRLAIDEVDQLVLETARWDGHEVAVRWEEGKAHLGIRETTHLQQLLLGFDAQPLTKMGDKQQKANIIAIPQRAGRMVLVRSGVPSDPADPDGVVMEFAKYPSGRWDDRVDTGALGVAEFGELGGGASFLGPAEILNAHQEMEGAVHTELEPGHLSELFSADL
jgi:phage terminase large subunit-like protein